MGKTRSLARALVGPIEPSHHMEYFLLWFWKRLSTGEQKKINLGNKERPNGYEFENVDGMWENSCLLIACHNDLLSIVGWVVESMATNVKSSAKSSSSALIDSLDGRKAAGSCMSVGRRPQQTGNQFRPKFISLATVYRGDRWPLSSSGTRRRICVSLFRCQKSACTGPRHPARRPAWRLWNDFLRNDSFPAHFILCCRSQRFYLEW